MPTESKAEHRPNAPSRHNLGIHFTWKPQAREVSALLPDIESALAPFHPRPHWGKCFTLKLDKIASSYPRHADFIALARLSPSRRQVSQHFSRKPVLIVEISPRYFAQNKRLHNDNRCDHCRDHELPPASTGPFHYGIFAVSEPGLTGVAAIQDAVAKS